MDVESEMDGNHSIKLITDFKTITMKLTQFILFLFLCPTLVLAQQTKTTEQSFKIPSSKIATLNLKFARSIDVKTWDKNEIVLKTTIEYNDEKYISWHTQEVDQNNGQLTVETGFQKNRAMEKNECWSCDDRDCICLRFSYEVFAPANISLDLQTISGDIDLTSWSGGIKAKSISGFIDLALNPGAKRSIKLKSVTGEVYTDLSELKLDDDSSAYFKKMNRQFNGGGETIQLETVSGDIYIRKGR